MINQFEAQPIYTIYLDTKQYIPDIPRPTEDCPWSIALNILASFKLAETMSGKVSLFFEYQDERGKHSVSVDFVELANEDNIMLANLVQIPIRGDLDDVCLKLVGIDSSTEVSTELLHVQFEESRSFVGNRPISKAI